MSDLSTIAVSQAVKRALAERGTAGESYNTVLKRLLNIENKVKLLSDGSEIPCQTATAIATDTGGNSRE